MARTLRPHDLRHTAVALAIQANWHPRKIQEMLGHSGIEVTLGTYGHLFDSLHGEGADRLDAIYAEAA
jgi:integrase